MRALTWQGRRDVQVEEVPDPTIEEPTDAIIEDHLDRPLRLRPAPLRGRSARSSTPGDVLGHEPMGVVEEVGPDVTEPRASATAWSCRSTSPAALLDVRRTGLHSQCETTQNREHGTGASAVRLHASSTARCPAARPSTCASRSATTCRSRCPTGPPDDRFLFLSDVLPTAWQAVSTPTCPTGGTLRRARPRPDRRHGRADRAAPRRWSGSSASTACPSGSSAARATAPRRSTSTRTSDDVADVVRELTGGRGADAVIDAVGMEAHGSPVGEARAEGRRPAARRRRRRR